MIIRSPFFYVGDKYKLMGQLVNLFPEKIDTYYDVFAGGGSSFLNVSARRYLVNDVNEKLIALHKKLASFAGDEHSLLKRVYEIINSYGLTCSYNGITTPKELKIQFPKTYFAKFNKEAYLKLRADYNNSSGADVIKLYVLLIYGFNHMLRFNKSGEFNLPVGNVDFNKNVVNALKNYIGFMENNDVTFSSSDYINFIARQEFKNNDFVYLDPPYLISSSEYNKLWDDSREHELYDLLDNLDRRGVRFGLSNMLEHKNRKNNILEKWASKYTVHSVKSNYISFNDNSVKIASREVYVTNYA